MLKYTVGIHTSNIELFVNSFVDLKKRQAIYMRTFVVGRRGDGVIRRIFILMYQPTFFPRGWDFQKHAPQTRTHIMCIATQLSSAFHNGALRKKVQHDSECLLEGRLSAVEAMNRAALRGCPRSPEMVARRAVTNLTSKEKM